MISQEIISIFERLSLYNRDHCGAGSFATKSRRRKFNFSFKSNDLDVGCYYDKSLIFRVKARFAKDNLVVKGRYFINDGQKGRFTAFRKE
jgi:hypothetical protein